MTCWPCRSAGGALPALAERPRRRPVAAELARRRAGRHRQPAAAPARSPTCRWAGRPRGVARRRRPATVPESRGCVAPRRRAASGRARRPTSGARGWSLAWTARWPAPAPTRSAPPSRRRCWPATASASTSAAHPPRLAEVSRRGRRRRRRTPSAGGAPGRSRRRPCAWARDLVNTPSNPRTRRGWPSQAARAAAPAPASPSRCSARTSWRADGFGGVLAVGGGSASPPRVVVARATARAAAPAAARRAGRQGHHVRHRRHLDQAQRGHARDEDRHGRRRPRCWPPSTPSPRLRAAGRR